MSRRIEDRLKELEMLPVLEPSADLEQATLLAMADASVGRSTRSLAKAASWIAVIGVGALLMLWTIDFDGSGGPGRPAVADEVFRQLAEESIVLEETLARLPQRQVMRVSTAGTIVGLEDQIELIDAELTRASAESADIAYRAALMHDRNELMNALVNVRYAQSRVFTY